ncbi:hypothetical protein G8C93_01980 [Cellulosimicrobium cellulans]|uniref:DUF6188 family protein n=1 Tax=Cellulosimicrobium cellulans TaxID=1710 RepID=UPI001883696B|nr:DUF6188 family protein [Cellulosimicrobium cellulans]MBE9924663.1 hypothetical protein [Cellulosimicrobium cellulans]
MISDGSVADRFAQGSLRGASLSQFAISINGVRLSFWGEDAASVCREVHVEQSVVRVVSGAGGHVAAYEWTDPQVSTALLACLGRPVLDVGVSGGRLTLHFSTEIAFRVDPDDEYEAWQISSDDGLRIVCAPGGEVSTWHPRER